MYERLLARRLAADKKSVLLLGPRQVGKSTLLGALRLDLSLNLASPAVFRDYVARPERLEAELRAARPGVRTVLLDEVQRVPAVELSGSPGLRAKAARGAAARAFGRAAVPGGLRG